ncbi:MAG: hypothetical protein ACOZAK_00530 [Patescibacteria group bacterium]
MKKTLYFTIVLSILLVIGLSACGGTVQSDTPSSLAPTVKAPYQPAGPTVYFYRNGDTVFVSFAGYDINDPEVVTPIDVSITGQAGEKTEGIDISFSWDLVEVIKPDLLADFDRLCSYQLDAVIGGRTAITQHIQAGTNTCWVEFVFVTE